MSQLTTCTVKYKYHLKYSHIKEIQNIVCANIKIIVRQLRINELWNIHCIYQQWTIKLTAKCIPTDVNDFPLIMDRIVVGMMIIFWFIIGTVYKSNLKAMLITPRIVRPFDSLETLLDSGIPFHAAKGSLVLETYEVSISLQDIETLINVYRISIDCVWWKA